MKTLSQKSALLFGAMWAVCAFAVPSMASAASWAPVGTSPVLFSNDVEFTILFPFFVARPTCTDVKFSADVVSASIVKITGATFKGCTGTGQVDIGCTATVTGTKFPWTMTAPSTTTIQISGIHVDLWFEPGPTGTCGGFVNHQNFTRSGNLLNGVWDPSAIGADRRVTFAGSDGDLLIDAVALRDTTETLNLLM
jgi:hypothetical protein